MPGLATYEELMALEIRPGATYNAFEVLVLTTLQKIGPDVYLALVMSVFAFAIHWQNRITLKLWRSIRQAKPHLPV